MGTSEANSPSDYWYHCPPGTPSYALLRDTYLYTPNPPTKYPTS